MFPPAPISSPSNKRQPVLSVEGSINRICRHYCMEQQEVAELGKHEMMDDFLFLQGELKMTKLGPCIGPPVARAGDL